jgi:hypothetical protein
MLGVFPWTLAPLAGGEKLLPGAEFNLESWVFWSRARFAAGAASSLNSLILLLLASSRSRIKLKLNRAGIFEY